jgi:hypothetical protein
MYKNVKILLSSYLRKCVKSLFIFQPIFISIGVQKNYNKAQKNPIFGKNRISKIKNEKISGNNFSHTL